MTVRQRARDLGITIGRMPPGPLNAITDIAGLTVGHTTLIDGEGDLVVGQGPVRTGVTMIRPHPESIARDPLFAGYHQLNGNGEMTGIAWIEESGLLTSPIGITNTHSVGVVRDAVIAWEARENVYDEDLSFGLPVVGETYDGWLNDINGFHVRPEHVFAALDGATSGPVAEGNVGGGTGMICHEFKGGIGTSSRVVRAAGGEWIVGALVQANYGWRSLLRVDGAPVGEVIGVDVVSSGSRFARKPQDPGAGSIIVILATDAPLLPHQCKRLAQRATIGLARVGGFGSNGSGDLFLAFSTGNRGVDPAGAHELTNVQHFPNSEISPLFEGAAEATEEAIINALCMAETMVGVNDRLCEAIPLDGLRDVVERFGRLNRA
jgi:D-aminopeptidase